MQVSPSLQICALTLILSARWRRCKRCEGQDHHAGSSTRTTCEVCVRSGRELSATGELCCSHQSLERAAVASTALPNQTCNRSDALNGVSLKVWEESPVQARVLQRPEKEEVGIV